MKKILKNSLMLVVTLTTMNSNASTVDFTKDVKKDQKMIVTFALNEINKVNLSIYDAEDKMIFSEKVNSEKVLNRNYDLNDFSDGIYFLESESDSKISRYKISVAGETASLSEEPISEIYKPTFVNNNGLVTVSLLNFDKSPVKIKIFDKSNNEVYDSNVILVEDLKKAFNIKNNIDEEFTFMMIYKDKTFMETFASN